jgi:hypothetical protein
MKSAQLLIKACSDNLKVQKMVAIYSRKSLKVFHLLNKAYSADLKVQNQNNDSFLPFNYAYHNGASLTYPEGEKDTQLKCTK